MSRLVFLLEEPSIKVLLEALLPRLFPALDILCIAHEGKSDLEKSPPRKLKAWNRPDDRFVVIRDSDGKDCKALKAALAEICAEAGRDDTLVRIVCQELEAWYFGDPDTLANVLGEPSLRNLSAKAAYRDPDAIAKPSRELVKLCPAFQKIDGARRMAHRLSYTRNRSASFRALVEGIARISSLSLPT
ncbi:DUF4276 family protein [Methylosinus sp. Sm6]|uniref:DUF4276 family protein n=1 Tax=Methylosinus sp. Sm6 TaxID=2866948 RepID=UPI001C996B6E|nr:DUF4276 family protein [Methylosinus sp. Sm6]MBY6243473.1 DUF4276 family protein [Methylosinus sp. Sm6]